MVLGVGSESGLGAGDGDMAGSVERFVDVRRHRALFREMLARSCHHRVSMRRTEYRLCHTTFSTSTEVEDAAVKVRKR